MSKVTEVKRKANVGERIRIVNADVTFGDYANGAEMVVSGLSGDSGVYVEPYCEDPAALSYINHNEYVVLVTEEVAPMNENITVLSDESIGGVLREYREVKRKARMGERVRIVGWGAENHVYKYEYKNGDVATVMETGVSGYARIPSKNAVGFASLSESEYTVLEPVEATAPLVQPTLDLAKQVAGLTDAVAKLTLQLRVAREDIVLIEEGVSADIRKLEREVTELKRTISPVNDAVDKPAALTRDQIVERAKADVAELARTHRDVYGKHPHFWPKVDGVRTDWSSMQRVEFIVNREKRTVVALIHFLPQCGGEIYARGFAKCAPDDCFNVHVGKAIALRRALGLEVPDIYGKAPQPTEARVGDIVKSTGGGSFTVVKSRVPDSDKLCVSYVNSGIFSGFVIDDSREDAPLIRREPRVGDAVRIIDASATNIGHSHYLSEDREYYVVEVNHVGRLKTPYSIAKSASDSYGIWCARDAFTFGKETEVNAA
ncbi:hypothetical protein [Cohnella silvisoli]|uniref:DUF2479 domain-containing protein n=1 Tax=Cohnella silvisoli TaxID=2873699 RepID=A0ABV1KYV3_9BACL|nr:hypothetical protein [Cohnella silvisoli]MCD9024345.1 hypothetical protein [Cohnella silvisoli]